MSIAARLDAVRARIAKSAEAAGRKPSEVTLVAVSKGQPVEAVLEAHAAGITDFGENIAQGLEAKCRALVKEPLRWHFVGRLQRNKVNQVLKYARVVHSVDRPELAQALATRAHEGAIDVLVQVNLGREPQKGGVDPDESVAFARQVAAYKGLRLLGLMGIPPVGQEPGPYFALLAQLSRALRGTPEGATATALSMGMSDDFEEAIRHGATLVRVGTAIFGERRGGQG